VSAVCGFDLSSKAVDIVCLDAESNRAEWLRVELVGSRAWDRTLALREAMPGPSWYEERGVFLCAIEAPYGRGQAGTQAVLNRVVGAVAASLPARLRTPERCWVVRPDEYRTGLGLKGKPGYKDVGLLSGGEFWNDDQNARDAYALAMWARDTNAKAVAA
jgi:hypothetical protein